MLVGRLAIDKAWQGQGLGADPLQDAVLRVITAAELIGMRAILVHASADSANAFYEKHGFHPSPVESTTSMIVIEETIRMILPAH